MSLRATLVACLLATGCSPPDEYLVVTVSARPAVHDATSIKVTLTNAGSMRTDELSLGGAAFPLSFSISAPEREGVLDVSVDAIDAAGLVVGRGSVVSMVEATTADVLLDTTDFVVNSTVAEDQFPSQDYEAHGSQVAAAMDGTWTVGYREGCSTPCNMLARKFDAVGRPAMTRIGAGTNGFPISTNLTTGISTPAVAVAGNTTMLVWDFAEPSPGTVEGIACRTLDPTGQALPDQVTLATDTSSDVTTVTALSNSNFAVTWNATPAVNTIIRSVIVRNDCTLVVPPLNVSTVTTATAHRVSVAASGMPSRVMYAWILDGSVRVRIADNLNAFQTPDTEFLPKSATERVEFVRVAPLGTGFAVIVRWVQQNASSGPGRLELYRTNMNGAVLGAPILVSSKSGTDFSSSEGFGVATRRDGVLLVTWHSCLTNGDGNGCGVWARAFTSEGMPLGPELVVPTTTIGDQTGPSVAALADSFVVVWNDTSATAPDASGTAVRARILYPTAATP